MVPKSSASKFSAPKTFQQLSKRTSQGSYQQSSILSGALNKLSANLKVETRTVGEIKGSTDIINPANEALRTYRQKSLTIDASLLSDIIKQIDTGGHEVCGRLDATLYSVLVQAVLQADYSRQGERLMYLLAAALYHDSNSVSKKRIISKKKELIGKDCLLPLLEFLIDPNNHDGMRRWVGLVFLQLCQGSDQNLQKLQLGPEDMRRKLGTQLMHETNEVLRGIFGQLIRALLDDGISIEHLWPAETKDTLYRAFPPASQGSRGWNDLFQEYVDVIWSEIDQPDSIDMVYWAQDVNITRALKFGTLGHNVQISMERNNITVWAASLPDVERFCQSIEIPSKFIRAATITARDGSQDLNGKANVKLVLGNDKDRFCYLDCVGTVINQIVMVMNMVDLEGVIEELRRMCPTLEFNDQTKDHRERMVSRASPHGSQSEDMVVFGFPEHHVTTSNLPRKIPKTQTQDRGLRTVAAVAEESQDILDEEDPPEVPIAENYNIEIQEHSLEAPQLARASAPKPRNGVKPKAKKPLALNQRSDMDNGSKQSTQSQIRTPDVQGTDTTAERASLGQLQSSERRKKDIMDLGAQFPDTDSAQRQVALVASGGNLTGATNLLRSNAKPDATTYNKKATIPGPSSQKTVGDGIAKQSRNRANNSDNVGPFDSKSITKPETNDTSTPNMFMATKDKPIKSISGHRTAVKKQLKLKAKTPLLPKKEAVRDVKGKVKAKAIDDDIDIPAGRDEEQQSNKVHKPLKKYTALSSKVTEKKAEELEADLKKRRSTPALLERPATGTRSKRAAAVTASQNFRDLSDNDIEELEELEDTTAKSTEIKPNQSDCVQNSQELLPKKATKALPASNVTNGDEIFSQQPDARSPGLLADYVAVSDANELYDSSPNSKLVPRSKPISQPAQPSKKKTVGVHPKRTIKSLPVVDIAGLMNDVVNSVPEQHIHENVLSDNPVLLSQDRPEPTAEKHVSDKSWNRVGDLRSSAVAPHLKQYSRGSKILRPSPLVMLPPSSATKSGTRQKKAAAKQMKVTEASHIEVENGKKLLPGSNTTAVEAVSKYTMIVIEDDEEEETESSESSPAEQMAVDTFSAEKAALNTPKPQSSGRSKKRKATQNTLTPSKRRRSQEDLSPEHTQSSLRRSPRIRKMTNAKETTPTSTEAKAKSPSLPTRISPCLVDRNKGASVQPGLPSISLKERASDLVDKASGLVDDHLSRKQTVISFSSKGPRNQGPPSSTSAIDSTIVKEKHPKHHSTVTTATEAERKRKRGSAAINEEDAPAEEQSPPKKRQSISPPKDLGLGNGDDSNDAQSSPLTDPIHYVSEVMPIQHELSRALKITTALAKNAASPTAPLLTFDSPAAMAETPTANTEVEEVATQGVASSPRPMIKPQCEGAASNKGNGRRALKPNLQNARVDENGSPIPSSNGQIDHIGNAKRKLLEDPPRLPESLHGRDIVSASPPGRFGARIVLGSIPKAHPSSPEAVATRYIPHKRTNGGSYEGVGTNEVVEPEKQLPDPFVDPLAGIPSGFTDRLLAYSSSMSKAPRPTATQVNKPAELTNRALEKTAATLVEIPPHGIKSTSRRVLRANGNGRVSKKGSHLSFEDAEKTLVNSENRPSFNDVPSEMTSGTSIDSHAEEEIRSSPSPPEQSSNAEWNVAVRPHYKNLSDAVHRIANEVIIRLSDEEDALGMLVDQYEENGNKLLSRLVQNRDLQKAEIERKVGNRRQELVKIYDEAKESVDRTKEVAELSIVATFEKQWRNDQDNIQRKMDEARQILDG